MTDAVINRLHLPIEWRHSIEPYHDAFDTERLATLVASMRANGWQGPPILCSRELMEVNQDRAYTGSHRLVAWPEAQDDPMVDFPCVFIEDICEVYGIDFDDLIEECNGEYEAVEEAIRRLPSEVAEAYGLDTGGA